MSTHPPDFRNRVGPDVNSDVNDPFGFTHVVEDSDRSDNASTRLPDNRANTRADATSAASDAHFFTDFATGGFFEAGDADAAGASTTPNTSATDATTATTPTPRPAQRRRAVHIGLSRDRTARIDAPTGR